MRKTDAVVDYRQVRRSINRLTDAVDKNSAKSELKSTNLKAAKIVENKSDSMVPVLTGKLLSTLRSSGTQKFGVVRVGTARVRYAGPIHWGWPEKRIKPNPFLYDAVNDESIRSEVMQTYNKNLSKLIKKYDLD